MVARDACARRPSRARGRRGAERELSAVPLVDARELAHVRRRTLAERVAVAAAAAAAVLVVVLVTRDPELTRSPLVPEGSDGIVVLDLSASISPDTYARIGSTLDELARGAGRAGLVVFSDVAYEALPPSTPAANLRPFVRYFTLDRPAQPGLLPGIPRSPWTGSFSGGTRISTGLSAALNAVGRDRLARPAVVLVSDLDDDPGDVPRLRELLNDFDARGIRLRVVSLNAAPEDERFFRRVVARDDLVQSRLPGERAGEPDRAHLPVALVVAVLAVALLLALRELRLPPLRWGDGR